MKPELIHGVELSSGEKITIEKWGRSGSKSVPLYIWLYRGRRVAPFERRVREFPEITFSGLFTLIYGKALDAIFKEESFVRAFKESTPFKPPEGEEWKGGTITVRALA